MRMTSIKLATHSWQAYFLLDSSGCFPLLSSKYHKFRKICNKSPEICNNFLKICNKYHEIFAIFNYYPVNVVSPEKYEISSTLSSK